MNKIVRWLDRNQWCFLADTRLNTRGNVSSAITQVPIFSSKRVIAAVFAVIIAAMLHGCLLFWYVTRPVPLPVTAAVPLPMISMELTAPPAPVTNQAAVPPKPEKPKEVIKPKPEKPKVNSKPKPKLRPAETVAKRVEIQKYDTESLIPAAAPQIQTQQHESLAAPKNDVFVPADSNAAYLNNPKPVYPSEARYRGWQGTVVIRVHVGADGQAQQVIVQRSSGHETLDESALDAVKEWKFVPAKRGDVAEPSWVSVPIVFELE